LQPAATEVVLLKKLGENEVQAALPRRWQLRAEIPPLRCGMTTLLSLKE
jgi:hypothetical protein